MMNIDTIIFDFNGTIIDDVDLCLNILNKMLTERNYQAVSKDKYLDIFDFPVKDYYVKAGFDFNKHPFSELAVEFINLYQPASLNCELYSSVIPFLENHKDKNLIILSASHKDKLNEQIDHFGIRKYFTAILGTDTIEGKGKLDVATEYLKNNNLNPQKTLLIGDTIHDLEVATALGVNCALVAKGHQSKERLLKHTKNVFDDMKDINI